MEEIFFAIEPHIISIECDCMLRRKEEEKDAKDMYIQNLKSTLSQCESKYVPNKPEDIPNAKLWVEILEIKEEIKNPKRQNYIKYCPSYGSTSSWECRCIKYY